LGDPISGVFYPAVGIKVQPAEDGYW